MVVSGTRGAIGQYPGGFDAGGVDAGGVELDEDDEPLPRSMRP